VSASQIRGKEKDLLFVNKKKQKNFIHYPSYGILCYNVSMGKVFWFFFSKKNIFLF